MKKSILLLSAFALMSSAIFAQKKNETKPTTVTSTTSTSAASTAASQAVADMNPDKFMKFTTEEHNFNTIPEGAPVSFDFEFKNIGKEPIVLSTVQASCGCTTPNWSKEPILPGKSSKITATYNTQGRPGAFTKTITVNSNVGTKVLKISGTVEKAPDASVPSNDNSMMKH
ncbi:MAG TPA: DUF1573 domain-containing protein [Chitinophagaceae bacterium]|nr:MAG: OmpA/MotB domain-containing protein [Bacteroidetes bacterium OLB11]HMN33103.1 DUF1573 domain-containing protein [Chitinophagaceae bacterium]